jgi:hypothetical protein
MLGSKCRSLLRCQQGFFSELACDEFQQVSGQGDVVILTQVFHLKFQPLNFSAT